MRYLTSIIGFLALCALNVSAQEPSKRPSNDSGLVVLKFSWERERLMSPGSVAPLMSEEELRQQGRRERLLEAARNSSNRPLTTQMETEQQRHANATAKASETKPPKDGYRYKVTLRNESSKQIKSIDWDYIFTDPETEEVLQRHEFTSDESIKPGKTKEIGVLYLNPPLKTVTVRMLVKKDPLPAKEQVSVARILYSDGSVWQRP